MVNLFTHNFSLTLYINFFTLISFINIHLFHLQSFFSLTFILFHPHTYTFHPHSSPKFFIQSHLLHLYSFPSSTLISFLHYNFFFLFFHLYFILLNMLCLRETFFKIILININLIDKI